MTTKTINLSNFTTEELMQEIRNRNDIVIVGNWYYKDHIMDCCDATEEEATAFLDEVDTDNDAVLENANENLQTLFENWKDEREQYCD